MRRLTRGKGAVLVAAFAAVAMLGACSSAASNGGSGGTSTEAPGAEVLNGKGLVNVTFWHAMSGANGDALQKVTNAFNASHTGKIKVNLQFKNTYDDTLTAYKSALSNGQTPDILQVYDIGTRFMIDSQSILPMQSFVDKDKFDTSDIQPNIAGYYTIDKKLYSMPFNTSMPLMYINKTAFTKAGLDPNNPPKTLDDIMAAAKKLTVKDASGNVVQYGFGASLYGWFFEQWTAAANEEMCDASNGRSGRATSVKLDTPTHVKLMQWWTQMVNQGLALKLDSNTENGDNAFTAGKVAMTLESTGSLGGFLKATKGKFDIGTGFYPKVNASDTGGPIIGGASLWVVGKGKKPEQERASWEFIKYLASADTQATWHTSTGYFPISKSALTTSVDQAWVGQRPQFKTAITQLQNTKLTTATQGCALGTLPQTRKAVENAMQAIVLQGKDPKATFDATEASLKTTISQYNQSVGG
ncbi:ABC transporter substrate-binding protein [Fodinicola feengrottensis]|uniref:ABC transporter substrate-binding protein n=1 Tax=Fodinicola feengrottensis TaxID=435914 RepID=A0ABN2I9T0_9ACTN